MHATGKQASGRTIEGASKRLKVPTVKRRKWTIGIHNKRELQGPSERMVKGVGEQTVSRASGRRKAQGARDQALLGGGGGCKAKPAERHMKHWRASEEPSGGL